MSYLILHLTFDFLVMLFYVYSLLFSIDWLFVTLFALKVAKYKPTWMIETQSINIEKVISDYLSLI